MSRRVLLVVYLLFVACLTCETVGQENIERHNEKNNPPFTDKHSMREISSQTKPDILELDEEKIHALIGRSGGRAKPLLLYLWYTDCEPCRTHFNDVERLSREYHGRGLDVIGVAVAPMDNKEKLLKYFASQATQVPIYLLKNLDDELAEDIFQKDWEVTVPSVFGYDRKGRVQIMLTQIEGDYYAGLKKAAEQLLSSAATLKSVSDKK